MTTEQLTAALAFDRYKSALDSGLLIQGSFQKDARDGRHLMCGLGAIDPSVNSISACPAQVMPRWLAQQVVYFFDGQNFDDAKAWGLEFYAQIKRLNGAVPFSVVHDWQANVVAPLAIETAEKLKRDTAPHVAKQSLHVRALAGDLANREEWGAVLRPAFRAVYADAYANADVAADAYADANAAYADAYADANADAYAYADADAKKLAVKRLAFGMMECLRRVPTPEVLQ